MGSACDRDLSHRALTGRGAPVTGDEVLALLEALEAMREDFEELTEELDGVKEALDAAEDKLAAHEREERPIRITRQKAFGKPLRFDVSLTLNEVSA